MTKIEDISKSFTKRIGKNLDELEFIYRNEEITFNNSKILGEIVSQSDINRKKIEIKVDKKYEAIIQEESFIKKHCQ